MKTRAIAAAGVLLAQLSVCGAQPQVFDWAMGTFAGQADVPVAMLLPVLVGRKQCHMQLDTGMGASVAWHEYSGKRTDMRPVKLAFAGRHVTVDASGAVRKLIAACRPGAPIGSIGNGFFEAGTLTIDMKNRRIGYRVGSTLLTDAQAQPFVYTGQGAADGGHVIVDIGVGTATGKALLDTGSAALDFGAFGPAWWERSTGGAALEASDQVTVFDVHAWGQQHRCFMAPGAGPLSVGSRTIASPSITHCPTIGTGRLSEFAGVVGMRPFAHHLITIDYPARRWHARPADQTGPGPSAEPSPGPGPCPATPPNARQHQEPPCRPEPKRSSSAHR